MRRLLIFAFCLILGGCDNRCAPRYSYDLKRPVKLVAVTERKVCTATFMAADGEILQVDNTGMCNLAGQEGQAVITEP